jgi:hypothetical protein
MYLSKIHGLYECIRIVHRIIWNTLTYMTYATATAYNWLNIRVWTQPYLDTRSAPLLEIFLRSDNCLNPHQVSNSQLLNRDPSLHSVAMHSSGHLQAMEVVRSLGADTNHHYQPKTETMKVLRSLGADTNHQYQHLADIHEVLRRGFESSISAFHINISRRLIWMIGIYA